MIEQSIHLADMLIQVAQQRADRFVVTSIRELQRDSEAFLRLPESLMETFTTQRAQVAAFMEQWLREAEQEPARHPFIALMSFHTRRFIKRNNQFVILGPAELRTLTDLYLGLLRALHAALIADTQSLALALRTVLTQHRQRLRRLMAALGLAGDRDGPICREYSAAFQTALLGLDTETVAFPLLDLGCGEQASFVRHLWRRGLAAFGLDLFAPTDLPFLVRADWLTASLGQRRWGTVISHMAFSHHFLHHHLGNHPVRASYARSYMRILAALRPGGQFIYTPGLPFMEDLLPPEQFHVEQRPLDMLLDTPANEQLTQIIGRTTFYVTCVRRLE